MNLSVVVPCYNEQDNLVELFERFSRSIPSDFSMEVIFVDNGSTDGSARLMADLLPRFPFARTVCVPVNLGYGYGILAGLQASTGEIVGWTHADLQTDPADVTASYRAYRSRLIAGQTVVKGKRIGRPFMDRVFTGAMSAVASLVLHTRITDVNAQPKLFTRDLLHHLQGAPWDFSLDLYLLWFARRNAYAIAEYPVRFGQRTAGEAKGGGSMRLKWKLTRRTLAFIFALRGRMSTDPGAHARRSS